jgi:hypothetical protein
MAWGASDAAIARMGAPSERDSAAEAAFATARDLLGESEFERLREAGAAMPLSDLIELVVSRLSDQVTAEAGEDSTVSRPASDSH